MKPFSNSHSLHWYVFRQNNGDVQGAYASSESKALADVTHRVAMQRGRRRKGEPEPTFTRDPEAERWADDFNSDKLLTPEAVASHPLIQGGRYEPGITS